MAFQFSFDPNQPHQLEAVQSVVELFTGLTRAEVPYQLVDISPNTPEEADLADYWLEENLHAVQSRHNERHPDAALNMGHLERDDGPLLEGVSNDSFSCPHFTLEMETGTGKTYVYFRTMLELHKLYGLHKFIVVVPSVAILEGVKKSFEIMRSHFITLYGLKNFTLVEYDGGQIGKVGNYARSTFPTVMVITQQAFNKASNNIYKQTEKLSGELRPYQRIQATRPIVVLDEPQNMGSERSKEAIRTLKPLFVLRYSATHRKGQQPNPVHRLTPIQAFRFGLVKQIEVLGISELGAVSATTLRLEEVLRDPIRAKVRVLVLKDGITTEQVITLRQNDALEKQTHMPEHRGMVVANIQVGSNGEPSTLELKGGVAGGMVVSTADEVVGSRVDVWRAQIQKTIEAHFQRQAELEAQGIKVLSLFFIDRVNNYLDTPGTLRILFDECFDKLKGSYPYWQKFEPSEVRSAYFAKTRKKDKATKQERDVYLDEVASDSDEAKEAFKLIMRDKERLLAFPDGKDEGKKVAFIFAHSALKEGWDNPNVFQICTLNQTTSTIKKRQEIGRGLRLCVNQQGQRPGGSNLNILTVIANESYESYVRNLQQDYVDDGETPPPVPKRPKDATARRRDTLYASREFRAFWKKLCQRLRYRIEVDSEALVTEAVRRLNGAAFPEAVLTISRGRFVVTEYGLRVKKLTGQGRVVLLIEQRSSAGVDSVLGFLNADERECAARVGDDLGKLTQNIHLRGFKLLKVYEKFGEIRVAFSNDVEISTSEVHRFQATDTRDKKEFIQDIGAGTQPVPDFIGRAASETSLTRKTLIQILEGMASSQREKLLRNPEGWANVFVHEVKEAMAEHIAERILYVYSGETVGDPESPDEFFPATDKHPQKELVPGGNKSLYDQVQIDSDVERRFIAERLCPDQEHLALYFKFPPRFKIELPKVIGNYNPDWGIVRFEQEGKMCLELVRETKGNDDLTRLRFTNEARKIRIAQKYFARLGIDYRALSPQVPDYWSADADAPRLRRGHLKLMVRGEAAPEGYVAVPVVSLKAAAGAFSRGQNPQELGCYHLPEQEAKRPGLFVAQVLGDSMDRVVPPESWCLWQHLGAEGVAPPSPGERLIARRQGGADLELGEFTFKRWSRAGAEERLEPMSTNPAHQPIVLDPYEPVHFVARLVKVVGE